MKCILTLAISCFFQFSFGQTDSGVIYKSAALKRGFYKNYQEFLHNTPSLTPSFETTYLHISKNDSTIIGASYKLKDRAKKTGRVWGFCDGGQVYIKFRAGMVGTRFWKLESLGPYPFFSYLEKDIVAMGPPLVAVATTAITASQPPQRILRTITPKGKTQTASYARLRKWLAPEPDLLAAFNKSAYKYSSKQDPNTSEPQYAKSFLERLQAIRESLLKLNERLVAKAR